ncbi:MAG: GNAT family N-acetyltransferase [Candidatus Marinimicrobia bacterium]|nr:GNAT family N-acetyltransferase [Candidatus Neomarinimicrobiota bacterium]
MNVIIKTVSYSNTHDRKILQSCLQNWFENPKELQFTDPRMFYPFDFRKWCSLSYKEENVTPFIAVIENWIVAYISVKVVPENRKAHLFHLFVDQKYRHQGIAKKLLAHAEHFAKELKLNYITLHVSPKNDRAKQIYEQFGFVDNGVTSRGSIKMKKEV